MVSPSQGRSNRRTREPGGPSLNSGIPRLFLPRSLRFAATDPATRDSRITPHDALLRHMRRRKNPPPEPQPTLRPPAHRAPSLLSLGSIRASQSNSASGPAHTRSLATTLISPPWHLGPARPRNQLTRTRRQRLDNTAEASRPARFDTLHAPAAPLSRSTACAALRTPSSAPSSDRPTPFPRPPSKATWLSADASTLCTPPLVSVNHLRRVALLA